jgi:TPR repeat protein
VLYAIATSVGGEEAAPQHPIPRYPMNKPTGFALQTFVTARAGLAGALSIAASMALGGCASQPNITPELPSAVVTNPPPAGPAHRASSPTPVCNGNDTPGCSDPRIALHEERRLNDAEERAAAITKNCTTGHVQSCFDLGVLFEEGRGVAQDKAPHMTPPVTASL